MSLVTMLPLQAYEAHTTETEYAAVSAESAFSPQSAQRKLTEDPFSKMDSQAAATSTLVTKGMDSQAVATSTLVTKGMDSQAAAASTLAAEVNQINTDLWPAVNQINTDLWPAVYQINTDLWPAVHADGSS